MANEESRPQKKPYEKPTVTKITREQAKLKLIERARMGDKQANELLDILFGKENEGQKDQQPETQSQDRPAVTFHLRFGSNEERQDKEDDTEGKKSA